MRSRRFGDAVGVEVDSGLVATFDEEADFRFGAGIAQKDAAFAVQVGLGGGEEFLDPGERVERRLVFNAQVALGLGVFFLFFGGPFLNSRVPLTSWTPVPCFSLPISFRITKKK